jgi:hypothetical protein
MLLAVRAVCVAGQWGLGVRVLAAARPSVSVCAGTARALTTAPAGRGSVGWKALRGRGGSRSRGVEWGGHAIINHPLPPPPPSRLCHPPPPNAPFSAPAVCSTALPFLCSIRGLHWPARHVPHQYLCRLLTHLGVWPLLAWRCPPSTAPSTQPTEEADEAGGGYTVSDVVVDGQKKKVSRRTAWFVKKNIKGSTKKMNHIARQVPAAAGDSDAPLSLRVPGSPPPPHPPPRCTTPLHPFHTYMSAHMPPPLGGGPMRAPPPEVTPFPFTRRSHPQVTHARHTISWCTCEGRCFRLGVAPLVMGLLALARCAAGCGPQCE